MLSWPWDQRPEGPVVKCFLYSLSKTRQEFGNSSILRGLRGDLGHQGWESSEAQGICSQRRLSGEGGLEHSKT